MGRDSQGRQTKYEKNNCYGPSDKTCCDNLTLPLPPEKTCNDVRRAHTKPDEHAHGFKAFAMTIFRQRNGDHAQNKCEKKSLQGELSASLRFYNRDLGDLRRWNC